MEKHWRCKRGLYEITQSIVFTFHSIFCSCNIFGCKSFFLCFCNQALHLKCTSHALKGVTHADPITFSTFCHLYLRQCCYTIIHECLYSAEFAQIVISDPSAFGKRAEIYLHELSSDVPNCLLVHLCFLWLIYHRKQCEADYFDLIWKLMHNANCVILLTVSVSVCIMPPLLYETHVIIIRPQS